MGEEYSFSGGKIKEKYAENYLFSLTLYNVQLLLYFAFNDLICSQKHYQAFQGEKQAFSNTSKYRQPAKFPTVWEESYNYGREGTLMLNFN